jgi:hypothetical protein
MIAWTGTFAVPASAAPVAILVQVRGARATVSLGPGHASATDVAVSVHGMRVRFSFPGLPQNVVFDGAVRGSKLTGRVRQGSLRGTFALRRGVSRIVQLLGALNERRFRAEELAGFARAMRRHATRVFADGETLPERMVDTCGTGGDDSGTFNISTAAAIVAAAAGALAGLATAVKLSFALVAGGLVVAALLAWWPRPASTGRPGRWRPLALAAGGVTAGFVVTAAAALLPWGPQSVDPALRAGSYVSIGSPWRAVRSALRPLVGEGHADSLVRAGAIVLAAALLALLARPLRGLAVAVTGAPATGDLAARDLVTGAPATGDLAARDLVTGAPATGDPATRDPAKRDPAWAVPVTAAQLTVLAGASCFVFGFAWLAAWPYVLPWYDGLGWALLALLPWAPLPWAALDWLVLARTAALAFGYLPARGIALPLGLGWLRSVIRTGVTPVALLAVTVVLLLLLRRSGSRSDVSPQRGGGESERAGVP